MRVPKGSVQVFTLLPQDTNYAFLMQCITFKNVFKTDKTADNPAQLDTAYKRLFSLIGILF